MLLYGEAHNGGMVQVRGEGVVGHGGSGDELREGGRREARRVGETQLIRRGARNDEELQTRRGRGGEADGNVARTALHGREVQAVRDAGRDEEQDGDEKGETPHSERRVRDA